MWKTYRASDMIFDLSTAFEVVVKPRRKHSAAPKALPLEYSILVTSQVFFQRERGHYILAFRQNHIKICLPCNFIFRFIIKKTRRHIFLI